MNELTDLVRKWFTLMLSLTACMGMALVCIVGWQMLASVNEERNQTKQILIAGIEKDLAQLSEERFLNLDSTEARQKILRELTRNAGELSISVGPATLDCQGKIWSDSGKSSMFKAQLKFDDLSVGCFRADIVWSEHLDGVAVYRTIAWCILAVVATGLAWIFAFRLFRAKMLEPMLASVREKERQAAIARMTEMLAHDVRKPFSILRMGVGMLGNAKDPASVKKVLSRLIPEIDKAVSSVDGLIADVMEVGSSSTALIQEPASPESLIEATLGETFRIYPKASIEISYDLRHTHMANVHVQKVGRVYSNIVGNAVQAMGQKGRIWFKTREADGQIEFCVGNAGSVIPEESLGKLFDAFFTSGKKGGTGLGLAIAQKVVKAHGGRIWCESAKTQEHPQGYVEFKFTLPIAAGQLTKTTARLPLHSTEITSALMTMDDAKPDQGSVDRSELTLEDEIIRSSAALGRPLRVLVVDDEAIYRSALAAYLGRTAELLAALDVVQASNDQAATAAAAEGGVDLVITDVDMGPDSLDGFELVAAMRSSGVQSMICVHSNRIVAADHKTAMIAGADAFLPKPVARAQLLRLVLQAAQASHQAAAVVERQGAPAAPATKPEVLVVDDNIFVLEAWVDTLREDAVVHTFTSLEDLKDRLEADPEFAGRLLLAVTDMNLDGSAGDGIDVGRLLKKYRPQLRVLLSSDGIIPAGDLLGAIDLAIGKDPVGLAALSAL